MSRGDWLKAALGEVAAIPGLWAKGVWLAGALGAYLGGSLLVTLLPWLRRPGERPPDRFAAAFGLIALAPVLWLAGVALAGGHEPYGPASPWVVLAGVKLAAWTNLGVVVLPRPLAGHYYTVSLRFAAWNLAVLGLALGLGVLLFGHALAEAFFSMAR